MAEVGGIKPQQPNFDVALESTKNDLDAFSSWVTQTHSKEEWNQQINILQRAREKLLAGYEDIKDRKGTIRSELPETVLATVLALQKSIQDQDLARIPVGKALEELQTVVGDIVDYKKVQGVTQERLEP